MLRKKYKSIVFILFLFLSVTVYGQNILDLVPYNGTPESFLTAQIRADTVATGGLGSWIAGRLDAIDTYDADLVLDGVEKRLA